MVSSIVPNSYTEKRPARGMARLQLLMLTRAGGKVLNLKFVAVLGVGLLQVLAFSVSTAYGNPCSAVKCPTGRQEIILCIVDPEMYESSKDRFYARMNCGWNTPQHYAKNMFEVKEILEKTSAKCQTVTNLRFVGHGAPGFHSAGEITLGNVAEAAQYNCVMAKNAKIDLIGCNTGRGCLGQMYMYKVAKALLPKGGSVSGKSYYAVAGQAYPWFWSPLGSRELVYTPASVPVDRWRYTYVAGLGKEHRAMDSCIAELDEQMALFEDYKKKSQQRNCSPTAEHLIVADEVQKRRLEFSKIESSNSLAPFEDQIFGKWHHPGFDPFRGLSDLAVRFLEKNEELAQCNAASPSSATDANATR